jgi:diketogulonate reductase-like aldo/keto reductase
MNEQDVGRAVRDSGIPREEIFVTSKLWPQDYAAADAPAGIKRTLDNLGLDYIDLMLLHQPYGPVDEAWAALEDAKAAGKIRSIGVSNMNVNIWNRWVPLFRTLPAVNQVECNPLFQQRELREVLDPLGVVLECWYPLGHGNAELLGNPTIVALAEKYGKNAGQIVLRFETQDGLVTLPKSTNPGRIASNLDVFDFELTDAEMDALRALDTGKGTHDPEDPVNEERLLAFRVH